MYIKISIISIIDQRNLHEPLWRLCKFEANSMIQKEPTLLADMQSPTRRKQEHSARERTQARSNSETLQDQTSQDEP